MPYVARGLDTYYEEHQEFPKDITLRKQIIKDWYITRLIASMEKCVTDKSRILSDTTKNIYREREYDTSFIVPDNLPLEEPFKEAGWLSDARLIETIYSNKTIQDIYHLQHLEYIKGYQETTPLSFLELIYPAKMPTKDYFPFTEFDLGTEIPLRLTEKERREGSYYSSITIEEDVWNYCILWIDKDRMFMSLECSDYYFKQIGKNVHFLNLIFQCV